MKYSLVTLEHICHTTASDEVINLDRSTSRASDYRMTNRTGDLLPVTGTVLQKFPLALSGVVVRHNIYSWNLNEEFMTAGCPDEPVTRQNVPVPCPQQRQQW